MAVRVHCVLPVYEEDLLVREKVWAKHEATTLVVSGMLNNIITTRIMYTSNNNKNNYSLANV